MNVIPKVNLPDISESRTKVKPTCRLDEIMVEQKAKGENYADWQARRYPVKASHREARERMEILEKKNMLEKG